MCSVVVEQTTFTALEILNSLILQRRSMARKIGVTVTLRPDQVEWLENHDESMSEAAREAIDGNDNMGGNNE